MDELKLRALDLFDDYVDLPAAQRAQWLLSLRDANPRLHGALSDLLQADRCHHALDEELPSGLVARLALLASPEQAALGDPRIGARLGPWRIDHAIGDICGGRRYLAYRDDGRYRQQVVLDCLNPELRDPYAVGSFLSERRRLVALRHPAIATVLDGGIDGDGRPWFATRPVEGQSIDAWCDDRRSSLAQRVELLIRACDALAHAHAHGVRHRHLATCSLLVDETGRLQLVGFGLPSLGRAGATEQTDTDATADGADDRIAVGADVRALGAVAFRLLCGRNPLPAGPGSAAASMAHALIDAPAGIAQHRALGDNRALARMLRGDLSLIVARAMAAQAGYPDMLTFAGDLRLWHAGLPIARDPSWLQRLRQTLHL
ncbi:protein kinase [Lysobacter sp. CCNWLW3]|uniref:protein kinase n=1 Tax=unclassified Lysobacter TaxID=2635362 RepID=UPI002FD31FE2